MYQSNLDYLFNDLNVDHKMLRKCKEYKIVIEAIKNKLINPKRAVDMNHDIITFYDNNVYFTITIDKIGWIFKRYQLNIYVCEVGGKEYVYPIKSIKSIRYHKNNDNNNDNNDYYYNNDIKMMVLKHHRIRRIIHKYT